MSIEHKLDLILQRLEVIESNLGIKSKSLFDNLQPTVTVEDAAKLMGCTQPKIRQYIKWNMLETFKVGGRRMIVSGSLADLIKSNANAQNRDGKNS
ncbi:helix-turn-helix domain-containing protein [Gammaproteobacteria bacterium]|jgi:excisionase family DNA binding protein|nr:helix-turn-helix domain-containing protein [Gammaproteobacteria bacterium]